MSAVIWLALKHHPTWWILALAGAGALAYAIYCVIFAIVFRLHDRWQARKERREAVLRDRLRQVDRLFPGTDSDCDPEAPCSLWDFKGDRPVEVICRNHLPGGKHHPPSSLYVGPEPPVVASQLFADLQMWEKEMRP